MPILKTTKLETKKLLIDLCPSTIKTKSRALLGVTYSWTDNLIVQRNNPIRSNERKREAT